MKIRNADELIRFLRTSDSLLLRLSDTIYLNKNLYNLLIENKWDCPLRNALMIAISEGLKVIKD